MKRARHSPEEEDSTQRDGGRDDARATRASKRINAPSKAGKDEGEQGTSSKLQHPFESLPIRENGDRLLSAEEPEAGESTAVEANSSDYPVSVQGNVER